METASGQWSSRTDPYGFERPDGFDHGTYDDFVASYLGVLARRKRRWERLRPSDKLRHGARVKRFVRKGIPGEHRRLVWLVSSGAHKMLSESPGLYHSLLTSKLDEQAIEVIKTDIPRTFPDNVYFQYPNEGLLPSLYNVLVAFVHYHPEIGYCQGLNYIAGVLLLVTRDEESSFWLLTTLVEHILPDYYSCGMRGLLVDTEVLAELIRARNPRLSEHLEQVGVAWPVIFTKWFICLFIDVLPIETVLRIWDCLFYEGSKILLRVGLTVILANAQSLMACADIGEVVGCLGYYSRSVSVVDCHTFVRSIFRVPKTLTTREIRQLRDKYMRMLQMKQAPKA